MAIRIILKILKILVKLILLLALLVLWLFYMLLVFLGNWCGIFIYFAGCLSTFAFFGQLLFLDDVPRLAMITSFVFSFVCFLLPGIGLVILDELADLFDWLWDFLLDW